MRADPRQRLEHPPHRAATERGIAVECRGDRATRHRSEHEPASSPRVAEIEYAPGRGKARDADAVDAPFSRTAPVNPGAERRYRLAGVKYVFTFEQSINSRLADRKRTEDERAMRNRFVAWHTHAALKWAMPAGGEFGCFGMHWVKSTGFALPRQPN